MEKYNYNNDTDRPGGNQVFDENQSILEDIIDILALVIAQIF